MRPLTKALQNPSLRTIAGWTIGLLAPLLFLRYVTRCARNDQLTLGGLSWLIDLLIDFGRLLDRLVRARAWYLVAAAVVLVTGRFFVFRARNKAVPAGFVEGAVAALLALASIVCMVGNNHFVAVALAVAAGLFVVAGGPARGTGEFVATRRSELLGWVGRERC